MDELPQRKRMRLPPEAYRRPGAFLVTIVAAGRVRRFGECRLGKVFHFNAGRVVQAVLLSVPVHHPEVVIDCSVVMPDHLHVIVIVTKYLQRGLPSVIGNFKAAATAALRQSCPSFEGPLWQRSFHDRRLSDERALAAARNYIRLNPLRE